MKILAVIVAFNPDPEDRRGSASGGVATMLARQVLSEGGDTESFMMK